MVGIKVSWDFVMGRIGTEIGERGRGCLGPKIQTHNLTQRGDRSWSIMSGKDCPSCYRVNLGDVQDGNDDWVQRRTEEIKMGQIIGGGRFCSSAPSKPP